VHPTTHTKPNVFSHLEPHLEHHLRDTKSYAILNNLHWLNGRQGSWTVPPTISPIMNDSFFTTLGKHICDRHKLISYIYNDNILRRSNGDLDSVHDTSENYLSAIYSSGPGTWDHRSFIKQTRVYYFLQKYLIHHQLFIAYINERKH
jgi:hypothetical protein